MGEELLCPDGVEYDGSTRASGARRLGSIPSSPTNLIYCRV